MDMYTVVFLFVSLVSLASTSPEQENTGWTSETYPLPGDKRCGNVSKTICDPDGLLGDKAPLLKAMIISVDIESCACGKCDPLQKETENMEGFKIGIAAIGKHKYDISSNTTWQQIDIQEFASAILKKWKLGSCRNGLIIAVSKDSSLYAVAVDETTTLRLHPECLKQKHSKEAKELIDQGKLVDGLILLIKDYKAMIKEGGCLLSRTLWLVIGFTLAPIGIIFAICYLACRSSSYVIKSRREKRNKQMIHKKLEEYSTPVPSESSGSDDDRGSEYGKYKRMSQRRKYDLPSVSHAVTIEEMKTGHPDTGDNEKRHSDVWVKATPK